MRLRFQTELWGVMSYEDTIQAIARELREVSQNFPQPTQRAAPKAAVRRKRSSERSDRLLSLLATLITILMAVAITASFVR